MYVIIRDQLIETLGGLRAGIVGTATAGFVAVTSLSIESRSSVEWWSGRALVFTTILAGLMTTYCQWAKVRMDQNAKKIASAAKDHDDRFAAAHMLAPVELTTVLMVEDNHKTAQAVGSILKRNGFEVIPAKSVEEAFAHIDGMIDFDCALIDLMLPGVNGDSPTGGELILNKLKDRPQMARVVMTAVGDDEIITRVEATGIPVYRKPIPLSDMRKIMDDLRRDRVSVSDQMQIGLDEIERA